MWKYSDRVIDHYENPRNVGVVENADAKGEVGSIVCGDALRLTLKIEDDIIKEARFKTFGCGSAIAAASALTEMIEGKSLEEAAKITNKDIVDYLGGLPQAKMHCSVMGQEALEAAILDYRGEKLDHKVEDEGEIICKCFGVTDQKIRRVALENNLHTVEEITDYTKAGGGCGSCLYRIEEIIDQLWEEQARKNNTGGKMTTVQKIKKIEVVIEEEIRPILRRDGGDIELIDVKDNQVVVRLMGMCSGCHAAVLTLKGLVEEKLRELVDPNLEVVQDGLG
ncbi:MAG: Fe-S cluster assembly protein NifU [Spirochaeta sp.]|nr:Fe-S cluster assembly protein NifU [Spirochaeta sp.]